MKQQLTHFFNFGTASLLAVFLCIISGTAYSQSDNCNYIITRTFTKNDGTSYQDKVDYYDGLGRPEQSVLKNAVLNGIDIVTLQEYDNLGRESNLWNPIGIAGNAGQYVSPGTIKNNAVSMYSDSNPYSMPVYDPSPLNRLLAQYGPGREWQLKFKSVKTSHLTNVAGNDTLNCICYSVSEVSNDTVLTLARVKNYESSQLFVTRIEDEDSNTSFEFKNKSGQVVLTRSVLRNVNGKQILDTYFIYNDFGNLTVVLAPEASEVFRTAASSSWNSRTDPTLLRYAFLYKHNSRNLPVAKKIPGCGWTLYIYDKSDRLIFSQDGNMRIRNQWVFSIPDALGEKCLFGICSNIFNALTDPLANTVVKAEWWYGTSTAGTGPYKGYFLSGISLNSPNVLQVNYYNDYSFLNKNGIPPETDTAVGYEQAAESERFGKHYTESAQGMLTGMLTSQLDNLGTQAYLYSVMYYDSNGRVIQAKSNNHLQGGLEKEYVAYDFVGQPLKRKYVHSATGKTTQTEVYEYTYDEAGRLLTTTHQLNGASKVVLVSNGYDAVGRLACNERNGVPALKTEYTYNVRSWMKGITGALFSQKLYYNDKRINNTNEARYNGNISGMDWRADSKNRGYDFLYDALSRLTGAKYLEGGHRDTLFDTSYSYDRHGNVLTLTRRGNAGTTTYNTVDNLTMNYIGNQLAKVEDTGTNPSLSMSLDFKNGTTQEIEYSYDRNGNMMKDLNKGISRIEYNVLNLPQTVTFTGANNSVNEYAYSATGKKLSVIHKSSTDKRTDYVGNIIYENSSLKRILVDGGYIENGIYHFFLQDHLGNNRIVVKADGTVVQTNHYYPYGMSFAESTQTSNQPYRYNGKELDTEYGLNLYDYGTRQMDGVVGRFTIVDPMSEMYYSSSPYAYCLNNSIYYVDPNGTFSTRFGAWLYKVSNGGGKILKDAGGEYFVSRRVEHTEDDGGITVKRTFDWGGRNSGKKLEVEKQANTYINDIKFQEILETHGMEYVKAKSRSGAITAMLQPALLTIMPNPFLKSGNALVNGRGLAAKALTSPTKTPVGRSGNVMNSVARQSPTTIDGTKFTAHALEQMQARGIISPSAVLDVVNNPLHVVPGNLPGTMIYFKDNLKVVTNTAGDIITVVWQ